MPTARELLEQADALMRRNRRTESDIPVLTDAIGAVPSQHEAPPPAAIPLLTDRVETIDIGDAPPPRPRAVQPLAPMLEGDPSDWLVMDTIDPNMHSVTGKAPDTLAVVPPVTLKTPEPPPPPRDIEPTTTRVTLKAAGSAPTPPPTSTGKWRVELLQGSVIEQDLLPGAGDGKPASRRPDALAPARANDEPGIFDSTAIPVEAVEQVPVDARSVAPVALAVEAPAPSATNDAERWRALAEQVSMQVLQRLDLFIDTGLKDQLADRLRPIVDRAGAELVAEINEQVGKLVRSYVAEAIEREIAQWRGQDNR
jgi:hypothetical protein